VTVHYAPYAQRIRPRLSQSDPSPRAYRLAVDETTLWAQWFFTGSAYSAFTLLRKLAGLWPRPGRTD
jgi:hypothetical protein